MSSAFLFVHWVILSVISIATAYVSSVNILKLINHCKSCSKSEYIKSKAAKDIKGATIFFIVASAIFLTGFVLSRFNRFSKTGFDPASNTKSLGGAFIYALYSIMLYNVLIFINYAAIYRKCASSACKDMQPFARDWERVKVFNGLFFGLAVSYIFFRFQCPGQKYGLPSRASCKRVLCNNSIRGGRKLAQQEYEDFKSKLKAAEKKHGSDTSRAIASAGVFDEGGELIGGDRALDYYQTLNKIDSCVDNAREQVAAMGFDKNTWGLDCDGFRESAKRYKATSSGKKAKDTEKDYIKRLLKRDREKRREKQKKLQKISS